MSVRPNLKILTALSILSAASTTFANSFYDVKSVTAPTYADQLIYSSTYDALIVKNSASAIRVINTATGAVTSTRLANWQFTDMSLSPSERYVYTADYGGENIGYGTPANTSFVQRYDLLTGNWQSKSSYIAGNIAAVNDDQFILQSLDQWVTFTNNSWGNGSAVTTLNTTGYYAGVYSGEIVYDQSTGRIIHGNSGSSSQELQAFKLVGNDFYRQEGSGIYGALQGFYGTPVLATDDSALYYGRAQVDPLDVSHVIQVFDEPIFAATADVAFGNGKYFDAHTGLLLGTLGFDSTVYGLAEDGKSFWAFDQANNKLHYFSAVPIPGGVWLMGSGLLGLVAASRRKRI